MIKHWSQIADIKGFSDKPFCILGTGESITNLKDFDKYNIWALNHAIIYPKKVFIAGVADEPFLPDLDLSKYEFDAIFTRHINVDSIAEAQLSNKTYFAEYTLDIPTHGKLFPVTYPIMHTGCSIDTCLYMLGCFGVKEVFTAGIDGSPQKNKMFHDTQSHKDAVNHKIDYKKHNEMGFRWAKEFGMKITKL